MTAHTVLVATVADCHVGFEICRPVLAHLGLLVHYTYILDTYDLCDGLFRHCWWRSVGVGVGGERMQVVDCIRCNIFRGAKPVTRNDYQY